MARIPPQEYQQLKQLEVVALTKAPGYHTLKNSLTIPSVTDSSLLAAEQACVALQTIFNNGYSILDAVVAECGHGPVSDSDTHYRGRIFESVLGGSFNGKSAPDFSYGDLKLIETRKDHILDQIMTAGVIFEKSKNQYVVTNDYYKSKFYLKMKQAIIVPYRKVGMQLGMTPDSVFVFQADDPTWNTQLKEDWESIRDEMKNAIQQFQAGQRKRRPSGICKSDTHGRRRPHGYLGIRSDGVIFTQKFFEIVSKHYSQKVLTMM